MLPPCMGGKVGCGPRYVYEMIATHARSHSATESLNHSANPPHSHLANQPHSRYGSPGRRKIMDYYADQKWQPVSPQNDRWFCGQKMAALVPK